MWSARFEGGKHNDSWGNVRYTFMYSAQICIIISKRTQVGKEINKATVCKAKIVITPFLRKNGRQKVLGQGKSLVRDIVYLKHNIFFFREKQLESKKNALVTLTMNRNDLLSS